MKHPTRRAERPVAGCVHRWRIAEPDGPESEGVCGHCGARRMYRNGGFGEERAIEISRARAGAASRRAKAARRAG